MSKPFIKKKFKYDVESDSETEPFHRQASEIGQSDSVVTRYLCDQFDLQKIASSIEDDQLDIEINIPKLAN